MAEKEETRRKFQEEIVRIRNMEEQMKTAQHQLGLFNNAMLEISNTKSALNMIKSMEKDTPSLLPIGAGMFATGTLSKKDVVLTDVGAGIVIEKKIEDAIKLLEEREENVKKNISLFQQSMTGIEKEYGQASARARKLAEQAQ